MRILRLLPVALLGTAAIGCTDDDDGNVVVVPPTDDTGGGGDEIPPTNVLQWRADITSNDPFVWTLFGTANVLQNEGEAAFTASIDIRNDEAGVSRPWHVHFGTCASGGGIVGEDLAYPRLPTDSAGAAALAVTIRGVGLDPNAAYHVNIHESDLYFSNLIACGDLILQ